MVKRRSAEASMGLGIGIGILVSVLITVIGAMILAWLMAQEKMELSSSNAASALIHYLSAFSGIMIATVLTKKNKLPVVGAVAGGYFLILLAVTALIFGGEYQGFLGGLIFTLLGGGAVMVLSIKRKKRAQTSKRRWKSR